MEMNLKRPFILIKQARIPKTPESSIGKHLRKKIKQENSPLPNIIKSPIETPKTPLLMYANYKETENNIDNYIYMKQMPKQEEENGMVFMNTQFNYNWSQNYFGNELKLILTNQSFDTQSSLSGGSQLEKNLKKASQKTTHESIKFSNNLNEKIYDNWTDGLSFIESDDQNCNDFMNLDGVCGKEVKKFPIPFDKKIFNYIEDNDF